MASGTESDSGEPHVGEDAPKDKLSQARRQEPAASDRWRPGRSMKNVELNLGRGATQNERGEIGMDDTGAYESEPDGSPSPQERPPYSFHLLTVRPILNQGQPSTSSSHTRKPIPPDWEPPLAVGASLGEGLSHLEKADRLVVQWEAILKTARETQPHADLSSFERQLEKVTQERDVMEESEENTLPADELESTKRERVDGRIDDLEEAWERTPSEAGKINIRAAIDAYKDGRIPCWDKWTLIYAGHVVDHCPTYESFTVDRDERLDRYFEDHGEGWLWFERPLAPKGNTQPEHLLAVTWANPSSHRSAGWSGPPDVLNITMGFRRVRTFHSRLAQPKATRTGMSESGQALAKSNPSDGKALSFTPKHAEISKMKIKDLQWGVHDDPNAPRCFFLMHLDSGASVPTLHKYDLAMLGINLELYPPQSDMEMGTVNGAIKTPMLEMRVDVCRHNGLSLVGDNPVWPDERHELGGILPVCILPDPKVSFKGDSGGLTTERLKAWRQQGEDVSEKALAKRVKQHNETRLSGILPFQVCYSACAPGMPMWFGEDRRDVLTAGRMPGQRRFEWHKSLLVPNPPDIPRRPEVQRRPETRRRPETQTPETQKPRVGGRATGRLTAILPKHEIDPEDKKRKRLQDNVGRSGRVQKPRRN